MFCRIYNAVKYYFYELVIIHIPSIHFKRVSEDGKIDILQRVLERRNENVMKQSMMKTLKCLKRHGSSGSKEKLNKNQRL